MTPRNPAQLSLLDLSTSATSAPQQPALGGGCAEMETPSPPKRLLDDSGRAEGALVDRTYQDCPMDPQVWVIFADGGIERLPVVDGWRNRHYLAAAVLARVQARSP
jgi:hypothetical protein